MYVGYVVYVVRNRLITENGVDAVPFSRWD